MLVHQSRVDASPSEFSGRLLDQDLVSHPCLLTSEAPLNCRVVPRLSAVISLYPPLEYPFQISERLPHLRHEFVEPREEGVVVEYRGESVEVRRRVAADRIRNGLPPESRSGSGVVRWIHHAILWASGYHILIY